MPTPALAPPRSFSCLPIGSCEVTGRARQLLELPGTRLPKAAPLGSQTPVTKKKFVPLAVTQRELTKSCISLKHVILFFVHEIMQIFSFLS